MNASSPYEVLIVGAGFSGMCLAIKLRERGCENFVIIDRECAVGGVWRDNTYPGAACDIPSHLYSLSFAPKSDWSCSFAGQQEIWDYLKDVANKHKLMPKMRFNCSLQGGEFNEGSGLWRVSVVEDGVKKDLYSQIFVVTTGPLTEPKMPNFPGMDTFSGKLFHSARWDHSCDVTGKRVAVIGSAASAIQVVPAIAPKVAKLDLYQRTPSWIAPRLNHKFWWVEKLIFKYVPFARKIYRACIYFGFESLMLVFVYFPRFMWLLQTINTLFICLVVRDRKLIAAVLPKYKMGCKRVLLTDDWYPALKRKNVEVINTGIKEVSSKGIVTIDGKLREADCVICCTGFEILDLEWPQHVRVEGGQTLAKFWETGPEAFFGCLVKGYPNFFNIPGPNTGLGNNSMVYMIECQANFASRLITRLRTMGQGSSVEVKPEEHDRFNKNVQRALKGTTWTSGCQSWYIHPTSGKIFSLWPGFTFMFWLRISFVRDSQLIWKRRQS